MWKSNTSVNKGAKQLPFDTLCVGMQDGAAAGENSILVLYIVKHAISVSLNNLLLDIHPGENIGPRVQMFTAATS